MCKSVLCSLLRISVDQSIIDQTIAKFKNHLEVQFASMRDAFRQLDDDRNGSISKQVASADLFPGVLALYMGMGQEFDCGSADRHSGHVCVSV